MKTFTKDGRDAALEDIKEWLHARQPVQPPTNFAYAPKSMRKQLLEEKVSAFVEKSRWKFQWRSDFHDRLGLRKDVIVRGSNFILELMEQALAEGEAVRLATRALLRLARAVGVVAVAAVLALPESFDDYLAANPAPAASGPAIGVITGEEVRLAAATEATLSVCPLSVLVQRPVGTSQIRISRS